MSERICITCDHCRASVVDNAITHYFCERPLEQQFRTDVVTGHQISGPKTLNRNCYDERRSPPTFAIPSCGPYGTFYAPKK